MPMMLEYTDEPDVKSAVIVCTLEYKNALIK